jgi:hypothetical protein
MERGKIRDPTTLPLISIQAALNLALKLGRGNV